MSRPYSQIRITMNLFHEVPRFAPAGKTGDRFDQFISFEGDLPIIPNFAAAPRVIDTAIRTTKFDGSQFNVMTPVCAARDVTANGFRLAAYNADPQFGGFSSFNWVAIEESFDMTNPAPEVRGGVLPPNHFAPFCESAFGNRTFRDHAFGGHGLFDSSVASVQIAATDHNVQGHVVPVAGIACNDREEVDLVEGMFVQNDRGKCMVGHNIDSVTRGCAFNWVKFSYSEQFVPASAARREPSIETGEVAEAWFEAGGRPGDWHTWDITFSEQFSQPPIVLLTATKAADIPIRLNAAVIGMVQAATTSGFRLAARSCDLRPGLAGFNWVAIGDLA